MPRQRTLLIFPPAKQILAVSSIPLNPKLTKPGGFYPKSQIARDSGLSEGTLYKWQKEARANGFVLPGGEKESEKWSTREKFSIVVETATLSEIELAEYCRAKGLYVEQVEAWRDACMQANGGVAQQASKLQKELRHKDREMKALARELQRKEAALAETAALLVFRKKAQAIWGDQEDE